ncbi:MAG TPA: type II secretion system protein [Candidatus Woesebacteria bacterium]|nr:type II secretion system protein [Candidatus Woesebacteria bacterium]HPJ17360.1 type II secretion system protein [Candidatus Woesebacteria bacterium]
MNRGFTLVELLIVIALVSVLSVAAISIINPFEQTNKAKDAKIKNLLTDIFQAHLRASTDNQPPYLSTALTNQSLDTTESLPFLTYLIDHQELKSSILKNDNLSKILLTINSPDLTLCYYPLSKTDKQFCLSTIIDTPTPINTSASEAELCINFDPERPNFPLTTNFTSLYHQLGCTNYVIHDYGCTDHYCPSGQRHLVKSYYKTTPFLQPCGAPEESYCVSDPYANCANIPYKSSDTDFKWGCSNPRRPYAWQSW